MTEAACTGFIPWATLGVSRLDSWGKIIRYSVTPAFADRRVFALNTPAKKTIQSRDDTGALIYLAGQAACTAANQCMPAVIFSHGKNNWGTGDSGGAIADGSTTNVDEDANNAASTNFISRTFTESTTVTGGEFDDLVTWLSPNILFNRMVAAGQLALGVYSPATVICPTRIDPHCRAPRTSTSLPTATMLRNMSLRLPAMVISSTGYWIFPPSTQKPAAPRE